MSLAKYMQLYREYGFFNGSTIRVRIPDTSFYGSDLILSKDGNVLRTRTIDDDVVDFFTDESGTLVLSADNGTSTLSGEVKISAYGTYNITLEGVSVDKSREVYAEKDVTLDDDKTTDTVAIGYTGDISKISAVSSNTSVCTVSVNGNKVTVKDAGKDFNGKATITATVEASQNYDAGEVNFYVNKLTGSYGTWADGTDETVSRMISEADAGEINLADFWQIGETRRVHLDAIAASAGVAAQPEQDIDLVIMHNATGNSYYPLTTALESGKAYPSFVIGVKDCLERLSSIVYKTRTIQANGWSGYTASNTAYTTSNSEIIDMLNSGFILSLPEWLQNLLKSVNRRFTDINTASNQVFQSSNGDCATYISMGTKSIKVSIPNIRELNFNSEVTGSGNSMPSGNGVFKRNGNMLGNNSATLANVANNQINSCGTPHDFYRNKNATKKQGINGNAVDFYVCDTFMSTSQGRTSSSAWNTAFSMAFYIDKNGELQTNNLDDETERIKLRGISPIMFI